MSNAFNYETIYIIRLYNGERNFTRERTTFDNYETEELLGEKRAKELCVEYLTKAKLDTSNDYTDITNVRINTLDLNNELNKLKLEILEQAKTVSGADDTYDYFPNLVFAFYQICIKTNSIPFYNTIIPILNSMENTIAEDQWETY